MNNKEIADELRSLLYKVKMSQAECSLDGLRIVRLRMVIDHLDAAIDLLDVQEPWV